MLREIDSYYLEKEEPNKGCLLALRSIVLAHDQHVTETQKWGMPCFCYKKKMFCFLWIDKKIDEPYLLFVEGKHLHHPDLEVGERSRTKILRINPTQDLPVATIKLILNQALSLYKDGTIRIK